ncbi:uncharacterized protein TNCV_2965881 [Trichonephila clavipes]|nr:uncharacterized protein TNCV_2965881 [Trichonephila clavipes]
MRFEQNFISECPINSTQILHIMNPRWGFIKNAQKTVSERSIDYEKNTDVCTPPLQDVLDPTLIYAADTLNICFLSERRRASRPGKQFNLVIDEEPLDNACHMWSRIILLKYSCVQALKVRKDNWLQHHGDVALAV